MTPETAGIGDDIRARIIASPDVILDDPAVMQALAAADARTMGENVVDLRGIAMERLEARLGRLEDAHRSVIATAHENLSGMALIHRAALRMLEAQSFDAFLRDLAGPVAEILRVERAALLVESPDGPGDGEALEIVPPGQITLMLTEGRAVSPRRVTLRRTEAGSQALLLLDLGGETALLQLVAADPEQFAPNQGTDLLAFFGGVVERALRRWL